MPSEDSAQAGPDLGKIYEVVLRKPETALRSILGKEVDVLNFEVSPFVKSTDHYGSSILKVNMTLKRGKTDQKEELEVVAKMMPPSDLQRSMFDSANTFKKEVFFYKELMPAYSELFKDGKKRLDIGPKFYGSRWSLNEDQDQIDDDAVLLMENLKLKGYFMKDRLEGMII